MRGGVLLLLVGILLAYLAVSGKYSCFTLFAKCIGGTGKCGCQDTTTPTTAITGASNTNNTLSIALPKLPPLPGAVISNIYG